MQLATPPDQQAALASAGWVGAWEWDAVSSVVYLDRGLATLLMRDPTLAGAPISSQQTSAFVHPDDLGWLTMNVVDAVKDNGRIDVEYRAFAADGSVRTIRNLGHACCDSDGAPLGARGVAFDVTARPLALRERVAPTMHSLSEGIERLVEARALLADRTIVALIDAALLAAGRALAQGLSRRYRQRLE